MKLFACYLGGRIPGCKIEMHDVAFCVADQIEDCYDNLQKQWMGELQGLHIDAFAALTHVDEHEILIEKKAEDAKPFGQSLDKQLYFVNLGGYEPRAFGEMHPTGFYVASDKKEAKARAKKELGAGLAVLHTDDLLDIDDCLNLADYLGEYRISLIPSDTNPQIEFICGYHLIPYSLADISAAV